MALCLVFFVLPAPAADLPPFDEGSAELRLALTDFAADSEVFEVFGGAADCFLVDLIG